MIRRHIGTLIYLPFSHMYTPYTMLQYLTNSETGITGEKGRLPTYKRENGRHIQGGIYQVYLSGCIGRLIPRGVPLRVYREAYTQEVYLSGVYREAYTQGCTSQVYIGWYIHRGVPSQVYIGWYIPRVYHSGV